MNREPKIEFIKSNRNKEQIVVDNKYLYNFYSSDKKGNKSYRCTSYKTINKCKSTIKLNSSNKIISYDHEHNHIISEKKAPRAKAKSEIKNKLQNLNNPLTIKAKNIYTESTNNLGLNIPEFNSLRSIINRNINKQFPKEIDNWDNIPDVHEYYKTLYGEDFLIKKSDNYLLFQSKSLANIQKNYSNNIFCDATFYAAPSISYQLLITRVESKEFNKFFTTSFCIMRNKEQKNYENIFKELINNINNFHINNRYLLKVFHCDLELGLSNAIIKVIPNIKVKFCLWHLYRALEINKNKYCNADDLDDNVNLLFKCITNLAFVDPQYTIKLYDVIFQKNTNEHFKNS